MFVLDSFFNLLSQIFHFDGNLTLVPLTSLEFIIIDNLQFARLPSSQFHRDKKLIHQNTTSIKLYSSRLYPLKILNNCRLNAQAQVSFPTVDLTHKFVIQDWLGKRTSNIESESGGMIENNIFNGCGRWGRGEALRRSCY